MWAQQVPTDLGQNPWLGGTLLGVVVALLGLLIRTFLRSDNRWDRLTEAQEGELNRTSDRLDAAEAKVVEAMMRAGAAEFRAKQAETAAARAETALETLRALHVRDTERCEADLAELREQLAALKVPKGD